jgi:hypothetical protein
LIKTRTGEGWRLAPEFEFNTRALIHLLDLPEWTRRSWPVVTSAITKLTNRPEPTLSDFGDELEAALIALDAEFKRQSSECWLIMPIKLPLTLSDVPPTTYEVLGRRFAFMRIESLKEYFGPLLKDASIRAELLLSMLELPRTVVCVGGEGFPTEGVFDSIAPAFDALRGAMELSLHFGRSRFMFGPTQPWGRIPHPGQLFALRPGKPVEAFPLTGVPDWEPDRECYGRNQLFENLRNITEALRSPPTDDAVEHLIGDLLRLYAQAMEQSEPAQQMLAFWQLAEALTLKKEEKGAADRVVARLSWFGRHLHISPESAVRHVLSSIMEKRNEMVHRGLYGLIDQTDVNLLKLVCETGIDWLIQHRRSLPTRSHLAHWWAHYAGAAASISALRDVSEFIEHSRRH